MNQAEAEAVYELRMKHDQLLDLLSKQRSESAALREQCHTWQFRAEGAAAEVSRARADLRISEAARSEAEQRCGVLELAARSASDKLAAAPEHEAVRGARTILRGALVEVEPPGALAPALLSKEQLCATLREVAALVEADDSIEGHLAYEAVDRAVYAVSGCYRLGNSQGQGGARVLGASTSAAQGGRP